MKLTSHQQGDTDNEPISAIPAAIKTKTSMLFGMWASAGEDGFAKELTALEKTIDQYCDKLDGLVAGISIGSEDLYRISPIGLAADGKAQALPGCEPDLLVKYIKQVRKTIKGTCLEKAPIGHVDTWTAFYNETNNPVIEACDWVGMDAYPYFEDTKPNAIDEARGLFQSALEKVQSASGGKEVWITETGWPVSGKKSGDAVASTKNARTFWEDVGCPLFGKTNTWWYTLLDSNSDGDATSKPSFGVVGEDLTSKPKYNLSCKGVKAEPSSSTKSHSSKPTASETEDKEQDKDDESETTSSHKASHTKESGSSSSKDTTLVSTPSPTAGSSSSSKDDESKGDSSEGSKGSESGSSEGGSSGGDSEKKPDTVEEGAANQLNSLAAVVVALGMAFFAL